MARNQIHRVTDIGAGSFTLGRQSSVQNAAGSGAGNPVTTSVAFTDNFGVGILPSSYNVLATPSQSCFVTVTAKTTSGFNVVLTPPAGVTLAAGTFDVLVIGS
jgi:hypothetical protein